MFDPKVYESDPTGKSPNTPGAKLDAGKLKPFLVLSEFAHALEKVTEVGTKGAIKYTERGWVSVDNGISRYKEASGRHQLKEWQGEVIDSDTGCDHEAQVIWNLLASYELKLRKRKQDFLNQPISKEQALAYVESLKQTQPNEPQVKPTGYII